MEGPNTEEAEAVIPMESVAINDGQNMTMLSLSGTTTHTLRRKAANRTETWYLGLSPPSPLRIIPARRSRERSTGPTEQQLPSSLASLALPPPPLQDEDEDVPAAKKRRLGGPLPTAADDAEAPDTQSNPRATGATRRGWTPEEDVELTGAVANTCKKMHGKEYRIDWVAVAALVPDRTKQQCKNRWNKFLNPSIAMTAGRVGAWAEDEDTKLKNAVLMHGRKDWGAITKLVPGRTRAQCRYRWHDYVDPIIDRTAGRTGTWTEVEDGKLKDAVQLHGGKGWVAISALVPGRTKKQCWSRWHNALKPIIDRTTGRTGTWTEEEDNKL
jgi:hypothetical protein